MIGGNINAMLQVRTTTQNRIGEDVESWEDVVDFEGFLDLASGDSKHTTYNAKIQESTHIFICDYKPIPEFVEVNGELVKVTSENTRMVAKSQNYDVMVIDDPMELHQQYEIYLKFTGGQ